MALTERYVTSTHTDASGHDGTEGDPWSWAQMLTDAAAGDRCNVKADGTYARTTAADAITNAGTAASPIWIRGYHTTPGDGYQGRANGGRGALVTTHMPSITYTNGAISEPDGYCIWESLNVTASSRNSWIAYLGYASVVRSAFSNTTNQVSAEGLLLNTHSTVLDSDCYSQYGPSAIRMQSGQSSALYCRASAPVGSAIRLTQTDMRVIGCIVYDSVIGISDESATRANHVIDSCTAYDCGTAFRRYNGASTGFIVITNCIATDCGVGFDSLYTTNALGLVRWRIRTRDNTSADSGWGDWPIYLPTTTDTGGPETDYLDAANGDFRLALGSPAIGAGSWGNDIGAIQAQLDPAEIAAAIWARTGRTLTS